MTTVRAQEVALPEPVTEDTTPLPAATSPSPTATIPPPQLIPPDVLPMPDPSAPPGTASGLSAVQQLDEELKPKPLSQESENYRLHVEWRKLRNQATNDPGVKAARAATERARNDVERRQLLANYFNVYFDKMIAIGPPEMKAYLNDRRREHLRSLPQPRVRPLSDEAAAQLKRERATQSTAALGTALSAPSPRPSKSPRSRP
ncbi:MAG: hypothetical protein H0X73_14320 [Chthoniobacterales bacterium]|nr:hypothetical protein [Chthoniobacterales bacterium]